MHQKSDLKVALVHDYLAEYGGAERVLEALHDLYPKAPVYTAFVDEVKLGLVWSKFEDWDIRPTWLTKIPFYKLLFSPLRIFAPQYFRALDLSEYDLVISSTNAYFAKAVRVPNGVHVCYCHTPSRSLWGYATMSDWKKNPFVRVIGTLINHYLRVIDVQVAQKVDFFIANSQETARRITKFYRRSAKVIYPPVIIPHQPPTSALTQKSPGAYFLYVNRLALAKHPEIAVRACLELGLPLMVVGQGKMRSQLEKMTQNFPNHQVKFLGAVSDAELNRLYAGAQALLYPVEDEDFGMVPVEAMARGVPVIAHCSGGPLETIMPGKTGILFGDLSAQGLVGAINSFKPTDFDAQKISLFASQFSVQNFEKNMKKYLATLV
ncbi:MAG: glycosyltransferase [Patescibacteria group bacterium]|nr:glycosyltransferase [Patescibacteria group bacterium]